MILLVEAWSKETLLSTGNTLDVEYDLFQNMVENETEQTKKMLDELYGKVYPKHTPEEYSTFSFFVSHPIPDWNKLSAYQQGGILASKIISDRLQLIERWHGHMENNKASERKNTNAKN